MSKVRQTTSGGQSLIGVFPISSGAVGTTASIIFDKNEDTAITGMVQLSKGVTIKPGNISNDPGLTTFFNTVTFESSDEPESVTTEDGTKESAGSSSLPVFCAVYLGGVVGGKVQIIVCPIKFTDNTGNLTSKYKQFTRREIEMQSVKWAGTSALSVPTAVFTALNTALTTASKAAVIDTTDALITSDALEIDSDTHGVEIWVDTP